MKIIKIETTAIKFPFNKMSLFYELYISIPKIIY